MHRPIRHRFDHDRRRLVPVRRDASRATVRRWTFAWVGFWCLMFVATHVPLRGPGTTPIPHVDKLVHFGMFLVLTLLGGRRLSVSSRPVRLRRFVAWALVYAAYAVADEALQPLVARTASVIDWVADLAGIVAGTLTLAVWQRPRTLSEPGRRDA